MWEVGGIKIDRTRARKFFSRLDTEICGKVIFWVKRSLPKVFIGKFFGGQYSRNPLRSVIHTQDSENIVGLGNRAYSYKRLKVRS